MKGLYTCAGLEISVATARTYITQLVAVYLLVIQCGKARGEIDEERCGELLAELNTLPGKIQKIVLFVEIEYLTIEILFQILVSFLK